MSYVYTTTELPEATFAMDPTPLTMAINLRAQAEKASRQQNMFDRRVGGWATWEQVQQARVTAIERLNASSGSDKAQYRSAVRDALATSLFSLLPPDRVGLIRCAAWCKWIMAASPPPCNTWVHLHSRLIPQASCASVTR